MPIRINASETGILGRMPLTLSGFSVDFDGTYSDPGVFAGSMNPTLGSFVVDFEGQFAQPGDFDGLIGLALDDFSIQFVGNQIQNIDGLVSISLDGFNVSFINSGNLDLDWQARISQPGVVWHHDFRLDSEIDAFRWTGGVGNDPNDVGRPNTVRRITSDGITGGCLEIFRPAGSADGAVWWRPFSPIVGSGNGKGADDPGANGSISVESYAATQGGGEIAGWQPGYYGNTVYHSSHPGRFDGTEYYFQVRVKMDARRATELDGGKLFYFTRTDQSLTSQEIVTQSGQDGNVSGRNFFNMYRSGSPALSSDDPGSENQVGNESGTCDWPAQINACWEWSNDWDTLLYRVRPGLHSNNDTLVQVYAAHPGESKYTRIWNQDNVDLPFAEIEGHGAVIFSCYQNGENFTTDVYHRYCQAIFSKDPIPAPLTSPTALQASADALSVGDSVTLADNPEQHKWDIQWMVSTIYYDRFRREIQYMGKGASSQSGPTGSSGEFTHYVFDEINDTWIEPIEPVVTFPDPSGHLWCHTFDETEGAYYFAEYQSAFMYKFDSQTRTWSTTAAGENVGGSGDAYTVNSNVAASIFGWHPSLFGSGKPGIIVLGGFGRFFAYDPKADTWTACQTSNGGVPYSGRNNGMCRYIPEIDSVIMFGQENGSTEAAILIAAGAGAETNAVSTGFITSTSAPPILISGKGVTVQGKIENHPENPNHLLCLEQGGSSGRVWDSTDYGATWTLRTSSTHPTNFAHPFDGMSSSSSNAFTIGSLPLHKSIMAISSSESPQGEIKLWKPGF